MIPDGEWATGDVVADFMPPHDVPPDDRTRSFDLGPVAIQDVSHGLSFQVWDAWAALDAQGGFMVVPRAGGQPVRYGGGIGGVDWLSLTWDHAGRPFFAFTNGDGSVWVHWYDTVSQAFVTADICAGAEPLAHLDERRAILTQDADIVLAYRVGGDALTRLQRDRFTIEYQTPIVGQAGLHLDRLAMAKNWRLRLSYTVPGGLVPCPAPTPLPAEIPYA